MDHEHESAADAQESPVDTSLTDETGFETVPPEDEAGEPAVVGDPGDDSDAPIRLDDLTPDEPAQDAGQQVRAENVTINQANAQSVEADTVTITQGAAGRVNADELSVEQGAVGFARTENLTVQSEASAFAIVAEKATVDPGANVFMLFTRSLEGEVHPVLDWRAALALGGGFALALTILRRLR